MSALRVITYLGLAAVVAVGCAEGQRSTDGSGGAVPVGTGAAGAVATGSPGGLLSGTVYAPNGTIPIAGALVYLADVAPPPRPDGVFCDDCVALDASTPYALSAPNGAFTLAPAKTGSQYLVVQKGGFRRSREIAIGAAAQALPATPTTLPSKRDLSVGDEVPRMTVVQGQYDDIEASLEKLGIDPAAIDLVGGPLVGVDAKGFLEDAAQVSRQQIVFLPCGDFTQPPPNVNLSANPLIEANLQQFVAAGGRLYVTDWHYDFVARGFPGFITWKDESATPCSGCETAPWSAPATIVDAGLAAWLDAQGIDGFSFEASYTHILGVSAEPGAAADGTATLITPRVWATAEVDGVAEATTVSFESGCGRVLFSTYHTEPLTLDLTPQERALLGILLDVSVCVGSSTGVVIR